MSTNYRSTPRFAFDGIKDVSARQEQSTPEARPQHLPHFFLWGQRGKLIPQILSGGDASKTFGSKTFNLRSKFATHQTVFANTALENANVSMIQRLVPSDAKRSTLRLELLVETKADQPTYKRDSDGNITRDSSGDIVYNPIENIISSSFDASVGDFPSASEVGEGDTWVVSVGGTVGGEVLQVGDKISALVNSPEDGWVEWGINVATFAKVTTKELTWLLSKIEAPSALFGLQVKRAGPTMGTEIHPIADLMGEFGEDSKNYGLSFSAPSISSSIPINDEAVVSNLAYVYRLVAKRKPEANVSASIVTTNVGENFVDFTLKADTVDPQFDAELFLGTSYFKSFENKNVNPRQYADLDGIHVYDAILDDLLTELETAERAALVLSGVRIDADATVDVIPTDGKHTINIMSGISYLDFQYESIRVQDGTAPAVESLGGTQLRGSVTHYLQGGEDGTLSTANFEAAVRNVFANYDAYTIPYIPGGDPDPRDILIDFTDIARWPQSAYWDSGFGSLTKTAMGAALVRPNLYIIWATHGSDGDNQLLNSFETSAGYNLVSAARLYPESELYGTGCCRGLVHLQSGKLLQGAWKKFLPLSLDLLNVISKYMGASDGVWKTNERFDLGDNKIVSIFDVDTVNHDKKLSARSQDWQNSTVYVQSFDRNQLMRPGVQTVFGDATSVLNSFLTVAAAVEIITICHRTWAEFTGVQTIQGQELLDAIDARMGELLAGNKFDGTVVIEVNTQYTARDANNGYSWTTNVVLRGPNMKTVGNFTVTSDRMEDTANA